MDFLNTTGELNLGAVILLTATLFIGISIGVVAVHTSGILSQPSASTAAVSIQEDQNEFVVSVYDMGEFEEIEISYNSKTEIVSREGEVSFNYAPLKTDLVIRGHNSKTSEDGVIIREETL